MTGTVSPVFSRRYKTRFSVYMCSTGIEQVSAAPESSSWDVYEDIITIVIAKLSLYYIVIT